MKLKLFISICLLLLSFQDGKKNVSGVESLEIKVSQPTENNVECVVKEEEADNDPVLIKSCDFENFRSIRTGKADDKGRYSYSYELYKIDQKGKHQIKNSDIFKSGADAVEEKINQDLQQEYEENLKNPQLKDCMEWIDFRYYSLNEMGMAFSDNDTLEFYINYDIGGACFNVSFSILNYTISEFKAYMK